MFAKLSVDTDMFSYDLRHSSPRASIECRFGPFSSGSFARGRYRRGRSEIPHFCSKLQSFPLSSRRISEKRRKTKKSEEKEKKTKKRRKTKKKRKKKGKIPPTPFTPTPLRTPQSVPVLIFWIVFFFQNPPDRGQSRKIRFSKFPGSGLK